MARFAGFARLAALILVLAPACATAQDSHPMAKDSQHVVKDSQHVAKDSQRAAQDSQYLKWDPATKTVTFELIAGADGAKSPFNFNGYTDGEANLVVPPSVNVVMNFYQKDGTPHSAEIIADKDPMPNAGGDAAIPKAYTSKVVEGLPQEATDVMRFTAPDSGRYRIFCGVPGHGLSGMWIRFTVDPAAKAPKFITPEK